MNLNLGNNVIPVVPFCDNKKDDQLSMVEIYLMNLRFVKNHYRRNLNDFGFLMKNQALVKRLKSSSENQEIIIVRSFENF